MKFELTPDRRKELKPLVAELDAWVRELEELELAELDPVEVGSAEATADASAN